ncbi:MAG TPA: hypothetical protein DDX07_03565, partial [Porphyromonadaceae bacterium]|nr:hypothetical protein [Porphyromonadaceae bacterium]
NDHKLFQNSLMSTSFFCGQIYKGSKVNLGRSRPNAYTEFKITKGLIYIDFLIVGIHLKSDGKSVN